MKIMSAAILAAAAGGLALAGCSEQSKPKTVKVFCAAGVKMPAEALAKQFNDAPARFDFAGTDTLIGRMKTSNERDLPDVFISADETYADDAMKLGLIDRRETVAYFTPVIVVSRKYTGPKIEKLSDLNQPGLKVVLGESRGPALGRVSNKLLHDAGLDEVADKAARHDTVQQVATPVSTGVADVAIIWLEVARQGDFATTMDVVAIPNAALSKIEICRVTKGPSRDLADKFIDLAVSQAGRAVFRQAGYPVEAPATQAE
jgi:molybdate transport system substrate-binding protein